MLEQKFYEEKLYKTNGGLNKKALFIGAALAAIYFAVLIVTADAIGIAKDEGYYFNASSSNIGWFKSLKDSAFSGKPAEAFSGGTIARYWDNNHEHPGFCKVLMGISHWFFNGFLGVFNHALSYRALSMTLATSVVFMIFVLALRFAGFFEALFAALVFILDPRVFFHAHQNVFDMPSVFFWLLSVLLFWKSLKRPWVGALFGVSWGVAMAIRNSGVFIPLVVAFVWLFSPLSSDFVRGCKNFKRGIIAFGALRLALAALWASLLLLTAYFQFGGSIRANQAGFAAMIIIAAGLPVILSVWRLLSSRFRDGYAKASRVVGLVFAGLGAIIAALTVAYGDRVFPFNAALLLVMLMSAGYVFWFYLFRAERMPAWARPIAAPIALGPITFFILWPWLYRDTWPRLGEFLNRHLHPPAWQTVYFNHFITDPPPYPPSYPWVMWAFTIPAVFLLLAVIGLFVYAAAAKRDRDKLKSELAQTSGADEKIAAWRESNYGRFIFLLVNLFLPIIVITLPSTPKYGGTKHYMHAVPFLAVFAAFGFRYFFDVVSPLFAPAFASAKKKVAAALLVIAALSAPAAAGLALSHPYGLGFYNEVMGGPIAAPEVGMQQSFWAYQMRNLIPWMNKNVPENGGVAFNNLPFDCWDMYMRDGMIRKDIRFVWQADQADFYITNSWQFYLDGTFDVEAAYGADGIVAHSDMLGLPMVYVHQNMKRIKGPVKTPWD